MKFEVTLAKLKLFKRIQESSTVSQQMRENKRTQGRFMNQLPRMAYGVREKRKGGVALQWLTQGVTVFFS